MSEAMTRVSSGSADFAIVGAGPVGLLTAILLARDGWQVVVVERWPARYPMPRACTIDHEALRILQAAGVMGEHADLADGANSAVHDLVGIESIDSGFEADWLVVDYQPLADEPWKAWEAFVTQYCDPDQPATAVKSGPGRRRFEFMRRADITVEELSRPETAWRLMEPWV